MRKIHVLGFALLAVFALTAFTASSAFALSFEKGLFLVKAEDALESGQLANAEGALLLEDSKLGIAVVCDGQLHGEFMGPEDLLITGALNLAGTEFKGLEGEGISCTTQKGCANEADIHVWPLNLPWLIVPELDIEDGKPWILFITSEASTLPTYEVDCLVLGILTEETCSAVEGSGNEVINGAAGLETASGVSVTPNGNCTTGGAGAGVITTTEIGKLTSPSGVVSISTP